MKLAPRNESEAFLCHDADHIHLRMVRCTRRTFLGGLASLGAGALFADQSASAEAAVDQPFRIDVHHHLSSPGFIAEITGRRTGQVPLMKWTVAQSSLPPMRRPNHASRFEGIAKNEIASFQGLRHGNLAISSHQSRQKTTLAQWVRNSSRATRYASQWPRGTTIAPGPEPLPPRSLELPFVRRRSR